MMSMNQNKVEHSKFIDTEYSSGDSNRMPIKQHYQEENNNEIDGLTKEFAGMGCIVDSIKRPPNICIENCVHAESDDGKSKNTTVEEERYSTDEFEDEDLEDESISTELKSVKSEAVKGSVKETDLVLIKSQSSMSTHRTKMTVSGRSTSYGSLPVPQTRRINMSFTNQRFREIDRHNHILLNKILTVRRSKTSSIPPIDKEVRKPVPPAAVLRKHQQKKIDHDNMILLKKIQRAKSSSYSHRR